MIRLLRGIGVPGWLVGGARGALEAAVFAAVPVVLDAASVTDAPDWVRIAAPLAALGWRSLEGTIDHLDPSKKRGE